MPSREYYLNADFDMSLSGRPSLLETADPTYVHEMAWHFAFACGEGDSLIVHKPFPHGFLEYIRGKGLMLPRAVPHPEFSPEAEFTPFGWNAHAESLAARYRNPSAHASLERVRAANSREYGLRAEQEVPAAGGLCGMPFDRLEALAAFLSGQDRPGGWVAKAAHGYAGTGNRRVPSGDLASEDRDRLVPLFENGGMVVVEPWHTRLIDMATLFTVTREGKADRLRGHTLLNSRDGAFLGVRIAADGLPPVRWRDELFNTAAQVAESLHGTGYFGPVGMDAYLWQSPDGERLRPMVDINARLSMSLPAHGLAARLPGRCVEWTWSKPRKLRLPADYAALDAALGAAAFAAGREEGILAVSPVFLENARPKRIGFALIAKDERGLERLRAAFAASLGRK